MERLYDFSETVKLIGPVRQGTNDEETKRKNYYAIRYAVKYKRVVEPREFGKAMLFTESQIKELKKHFECERRGADAKQ